MTHRGRVVNAAALRQKGQGLSGCFEFCFHFSPCVSSFLSESKKKNMQAFFHRSHQIGQRCECEWLFKAQVCGEKHRKPWMSVPRWNCRVVSRFFLVDVDVMNTKKKKDLETPVITEGSASVPSDKVKSTRQHLWVGDETPSLWSSDCSSTTTVIPLAVDLWSPGSKQ